MDLGPITFDGEEWIEFGPDRRRIGFHDYAALYAVPGLYEHVFRETLGMRTADILVDHYGQQLRTCCRIVSDERVLDVGAGNGIGGRLLRALGVGYVVGVDAEPMARQAAERDQGPSVYDRYLVASADQVATEWDGPPFTALLALAAVGGDAISVRDLLDLALEVVEPTGHVVFAVSEDLADDVTRTFDRGPLRCLAATPFLHRRRPDRSEHCAVAFLAQTAGSPHAQRDRT